MKTSFSAACFLGMLGIALATVHCLGSTAGRSTPPGSWLTVTEELAEAQRRSDELDILQQAVFGHVEAKHALLQDLIDERLALVEAAVRFQRLGSPLPAYDRELASLYPGLSGVERACRHLINGIAALLREDPARATQVTARLEAELQAYQLWELVLLWPAVE